jgi:RNA 2',3'-cyclic 3'-phosphodiesterase
VRLFVALAIPGSVREKLAGLMQQMRSIAPELKWVRAENLHITLKFIGEVEAERLDPIIAALTGAASGAPASAAAPLALEFRGVGFFRKRHLLVLFATLEASSSLQSLASEIDRRLATVGIAAEQRAFTPHATLARSDASNLLVKLRPFIDENSSRSLGSFPAHEFHLIQSKLKSTGAEYTTLQSFPFGVGA